MDDQFYLQDSRGYVGNDMLWWAKDGHGYTTDLSKAHIYTKQEAVSQHNCRETDIPWPKSYIDTKTRPAVDMQYVEIVDALSGTGIVLHKPSTKRREQYRCHGCGIFLGIADLYRDCQKCGADNRP